MFKVICIKTGEEVDPMIGGFLINPFNGSLYARGRNVTSEYRLEPKNAPDVSKLSQKPLLLILNQLDNIQMTFGLLSANLEKLKGGALKAFLVICEETVLKNRTTAIIRNERFMQAGCHLTRRDFIIKACQDLIDKKLIIRKEVDTFTFSYSIGGGT